MRDESIYGLMQRNTRDECWRKLTAAVNNHVLDGGWSNPSLRLVLVFVFCFFSSKSSRMICQELGRQEGGSCSVTVAFGDAGHFLQSL